MTGFFAAVAVTIAVTTGIVIHRRKQSNK